MNRIKASSEFYVAFKRYAKPLVQHGLYPEEDCNSILLTGPFKSSLKEHISFRVRQWDDCKVANQWDIGPTMEPEILSDIGDRWSSIDTNDGYFNNKFLFGIDLATISLKIKQKGKLVFLKMESLWDLEKFNKYQIEVFNDMPDYRCAELTKNIIVFPESMIKVEDDNIGLNINGRYKIDHVEGLTESLKLNMYEDKI